MKIGWGTDEKAIISILGRRNAIQRKLIRQAYEDLYEEDLVKRLESELSGDFEVTPPPIPNPHQPKMNYFKNL